MAAPAEDYLIPVLDEEVLSYFSPEAEDYLSSIQMLLQRLESDLQNPETIHQLYRVAHTLKGSAYTVGFQEQSTTAPRRRGWESDSSLTV